MMFLIMSLLIILLHVKEDSYVHNIFARRGISFGI